MQGLDKTLSLFAKNSTVAAFKELVEYNEAGIAKQVAKDLGFNVDKLGESYSSAFISKTPTVHVAELDQELYDKALSLPETKSVSLKRISTTSKYQYGKFKGGNTYTTIDGELNIATTNTLPQEGWIIVDNSYPDYYLFYNDDITTFISVKDFEPTPIVEDFMPLYEKLKSRGRYNNEFLDDLHLGFSLAASYKAAITELIMEKYYKVWLLYMNAMRSAYSFALFNEIISSKNRSYIEQEYAEYINRYKNMQSTELTTDRVDAYYGIYPKQLVSNKDWLFKHYEGGVNYQARIYAEDGKDSNVLICLQQPESISYSVSSQYDSVSPRGSQIPFQFYNCANAVTMSFTLKFHNDDVKSINGGNKDQAFAYSLQYIEELAILFARPKESGNSIKPRLCTVDLPGIHRQGYISSVQVNHTGDLTGDYTAGTSDNTYTLKNSSTPIATQYGNYKKEHSINTYYNQLELTFEMILIPTKVALSWGGSNNMSIEQDNASVEKLRNRDEYMSNNWKQTPEQARNDSIIDTLVDSISSISINNIVNKFEAGIDSIKQQARDKALNDAIKNVGTINKVSSFTFGELSELSNISTDLFSLLFN